MLNEEGIFNGRQLFITMVRIDDLLVDLKQEMVGIFCDILYFSTTIPYLTNCLRHLRLIICTHVESH